MSVADPFKRALKAAGAYELDKAATERLTKSAFTFEGGGKGCARAHVNKDLVGQDAAVLAHAAGVQAPPAVELLFSSSRGRREKPTPEMKMLDAEEWPDHGKNPC